MKTTPLILTTLLASALSFTGCSSGPDQSAPASASTHKHHHEDADNSDSDPSTKKPRIGMTQNQVRAIYGDPSNVSQTGDGEIWTYWFNKGHAFIPYNYGYKAKTGTFIFNNSGTLKNYSMNE